MNRHLRGALTGALVSGVLVTPACDGPEPLPTPSPDQIAPAPAPEPALEDPSATLGEDQLFASTYRLPQFDGQATRFRGGEFQDTVNRRFASVVPSLRARGDFDGDGSGEVAMVIAANTGGSGLFMNLVLMGMTGGRPTQEALVELGDRVQVLGMMADGQALVVDLVVHANADPLCCPTLRRSMRFEMVNGEWVGEIG